MKSIAKLLLEEPFDTYSGFLRVTFKEEEYNASTATEAIRGVQDVTVARMVDTGIERGNKVVLSVKARTTLSGEDVFKKIRSEALRLPGILKVEIGTKTIEKI